MKPAEPMIQLIRVIEPKAASDAGSRKMPAPMILPATSAPAPTRPSFLSTPADVS